MLKKAGSTRKGYRTTFSQGVQWRRERYRTSKFARFRRLVAEGIVGAGRWVLGGVAFIIAFVVGLISPRGRRAAGNAQSSVAIPTQNNDQEKPRLSQTEYTILRRTGLVALAVVMLLGGVAAAKPIQVMVMSNTVTLMDEGAAVEITTMAETVGELIDSYGIVLTEGDIVFPERDEPLKEGTQVMVRRAMSISTLADGVERDLRIQAGTVRDALALSGIGVGEYDIIEPALDTKLSPGVSIEVTRVEIETLTETQRMYYYEKTQKDKSLYVGTTEIAQEGKEGSKEVDYQVVYHDGEEISRDVVAERIIEAPVHRIVSIGTKEKPVATPKPTATPKSTKASSSSSTSSSSSSSSSGSRYKVTKYAVVDNQTNKRYEIQETDKFMITAYTHTGRKTSTGTWPKVGTIAVDPKVIPYGTYIYVPGYGIGKAADTGPSAKHLDLFFDTYEECIQYGRKRNVKIYILEKPTAVE